MRYFGGKVRIAKQLCAYLNDALATGRYTRFVDAFCGSMNVTCGIDFPNRWASDINPYVIAVYEHALAGGTFPTDINYAEYKHVQQAKDLYPAWYVGFIGFGCSFSGKFFGGLARDNTDRNYAQNAVNSIKEKTAKLQSATLLNCGYQDLDLTTSDLVYCDIPYHCTTKYNGTIDFNHEAFYHWAQSTPATVFVSEYLHNLPACGEVVLQIESKQDIRSKDGQRKPTTEILFKIIK